MYITYWNPPTGVQITFDEMLVGVQNVSELDDVSLRDETRTRTYWFDTISQKILDKTNVRSMISSIKKFNQKYADLQKDNLSDHYYSFEIPKKSGGTRKIDAPDDVLKLALTELRTLLRSFMIADYHNCAYAYIKHRCALDAVKLHQSGRKKTKLNPETGKLEVVTFENNWSVKFDFHGFFPSTTFGFLIGMLNLIYPFGLIMQNEEGKTELKKALRMCFLNGGLPQGTPISPWLTNVMMIPFDYKMNKALSKFESANGKTYEFTYTRYSDDITISSYLEFDWVEIQNLVKSIMEQQHTPFSLNEEKTHYGNRHSSKNWMLGVMWNQDNQITVGWRNLKNFKAMCCNYITSNKNGTKWDLEDVQQFNGTMNYYRMVDPEKIDGIIAKYNRKFHCDMRAMLRSDLGCKE